MTEKVITLPPKTCGECQVCCQGTLTGNAHGYEFWPGRPCFFSCKSGCKIYDYRPQMCVDYYCVYMEEHWVPDWMRPDQSGVLMTRKETPSKIPYIQVLECFGKTMPSYVLNWIFMSHVTGEIPNIAYQIQGGWNYIGTPEFLAEVKQ